MPAPSWLNRKVAAISAALAALVFMVFAQTAGFQFVNYDDGPNVFENPVISRGLTLQGMGWAFTHSQIGHWDPVTTLSHMADCQLYGLWAGGHHINNVIFHAATAILLFILLLEMTGAFWPSAFVAAAWAIHPLRVESVAWVTERKDVLSGFFFMLTLLAYFAYARQPKSKLRYCGVALFLILGLMSKSMLMTVPCVLLLLDYWPLKRWQPGQGAAGLRTAWHLFLEKIPLQLIAIIFALAAIAADRKEMASIQKAPLLQRAGDALAMYLVYLKQTIWPVDLLPAYVRPPGGLPAAELLLAAAVVGLITALVIWRRKEQPWLVTGWLWYLGMLVPVAGFFQSQKFPQDDRYTYLPQIGLWIALAWSVAAWSARWPRHRMLLGSIAAIVLCIFSALAFHQAAFWRNSESLWTHTLACSRDNPVAYYNFGCDLFQRGNINAAIAQYQKALEIDPAYAEAHGNLGIALAQQGRLSEAIAQYNQALQIMPASAGAHYNLGSALQQEGRLNEAIAQYTETLRIDPDYAKAHTNLGNTLLQQGRIADAFAQYTAALQIDPALSEARINLGNILCQQGRLDDAVAQYTAALQINPTLADAHNGLGNIFLQQGKLDDAIVQYHAALQSNPSNAAAHNNLGFALFQQGRTQDAIAEYRVALQINPTFTNASNNLRDALRSTHPASN